MIKNYDISKIRVGDKVYIEGYTPKQYTGTVVSLDNSISIMWEGTSYMSPPYSPQTNNKGFFKVGHGNYYSVSKKKILVVINDE